MSRENAIEPINTCLKAIKLLALEPDETVLRIVADWPRNFDAQRALALGFRAESSFEEIIRVYVEDELGDHLPAVAS